MKKILISTALATAFCAVNAHEAAHATADHHAFQGAYLGLGVHVSSYADEVWSTYPAETTEATTEAQTSSLKFIAGDNKETDGHADKIGGTVLFGYGKAFSSNTYFGGEIGADFSPSKTVTEHDKASMSTTLSYDLDVKRSSFNPFAALRFGCVVGGDLLMYVKAGASHARTKEEYGLYAMGATQSEDYKAKSSFSKTSIMPLVALGVEKAIAQKVTARVEGEYRFGKSWTKEFKPLTKAQVEAGVGSGATSMKIKQKPAITLRLMFCYHPKI